MRVTVIFSVPLFALSSFLIIGSSTLEPPSAETLSTAANKDISTCEPVEVNPCAKLYSSTHLPNVYGHTSFIVAAEKVNETLSNFSKQINIVVAFMCTLYLPPCSSGSNSNGADLFESLSGIRPFPCRPVCELAVQEARQFLINKEQQWPIVCNTLPTENCINYLGPNNVAFVKRTINATPSRTSLNEIANFAPLDVELGNDEGYEVEVVSLSANQIPERRYDIANLGDPNYFQGWTDVQGSGAANDYCRVIGKGKHRFLSCNLAGSTGQGHHYVSKLGFEAGHPDTWFMRDMDGDNRDDYCRCVVSKNHSRITCMKAGENGFYGSTTQGGNQHTFSIPNSDGCHKYRYNPMFGERVV